MMRGMIVFSKSQFETISLNSGWAKNTGEWEIIRQMEATLTRGANYGKESDTGGVSLHFGRGERE